MTPSPFAEFVTDKVPPLGKICDIGCGNRRDSNLFLRNGHTVTAIDPSQPALYPSEQPFQDRLHCLRFGAKEALKSLPPQDAFYLRWFLHSMPFSQSQQVFERVVQNLREDGLLFIEVRSIMDDKLRELSTFEASTGAWMTNHRRWLFAPEILEQWSNNTGLKILFLKQNRGWSVSENDDPLLIRFIGQKTKMTQTTSLK